MALKSAAAPAPASAAANSEFRRSRVVSESIDATKDKAQESAPQFVGGRTFFQNGTIWVDSLVQKLPKAQHLSIKLGSPEYFDLVAKHPETAPWLALGQQVQFVLDGKVYEIHE